MRPLYGAAEADPAICPNVPLFAVTRFARPMKQRIRYLRTADGQSLAWAEAGRGRSLVKASTRLTHLEAALMNARGDVDVRHLLHQVRTPTLVLHAERDQITPMSEGKRLATEIPGASFVALDSCNHVLLQHETAWAQFQRASLEFTGQTASEDDGRTDVSAALTRRERQIFELLCGGSSNADVASALGISEQTTRNHLSHLYEKLGVHSRAAAILFAHAHKLHPERDP